MDRAQPQPAAASQPLIVAGTVIAGRYRLEELVGQGAMGAVWRAEHLRLGSSVAVKLMGDQLAKVPSAEERFLREAKAAARLASEYVVRVYDFGVHGETPFLVMELLQGESLRDRLDKQGRLPFEQVATIVIHCCRALQRAHAAGVIHRDLKPENLFLVEEGQLMVKVLDFGIAKVSGDWAEPQHSHTQTGAVLGTPYYMSPEQVRGRGVLDHRADLWAIAVIAREALCGQLPFEGETFGDLVLKICTETAQETHLGPPGFKAWLAKGLAKRPMDRFDSAKAMGAELAKLCGSSCEAKTPFGAGQSVARVAAVSAADGCPALVNPSPASFAAVAVGTQARVTSARASLWLGAALVLGLVAALVLQRRGSTPSVPHRPHLAASVPEAPGEPSRVPPNGNTRTTGEKSPPSLLGLEAQRLPVVERENAGVPDVVAPSDGSGDRPREKMLQARQPPVAARGAKRSRNSKKSRRRSVRGKKIPRPTVVSADLFSEPD